MPEKCHDEWKTKDTDPDAEVWRMSLVRSIRKHPLVCWQSVEGLSMTQSPECSGRLEAWIRSFWKVQASLVNLTAAIYSIPCHQTKESRNVAGGKKKKERREEWWNNWSLGQTSPTHPLKGLSLWLLTLCVISNHSHITQRRHIWSSG